MLLVKKTPYGPGVPLATSIHDPDDGADWSPHCLFSPCLSLWHGMYYHWSDDQRHHVMCPFCRPNDMPEFKPYHAVPGQTRGLFSDGTTADLYTPPNAKWPWEVDDNWRHTLDWHLTWFVDNILPAETERRLRKIEAGERI